MNRKTNYLLLFLVLLACGTLYSQNTVDIEKTLILSYVESDDTALHFKALNSMEKRIGERGYLDDDLLQLVKAMALHSIRTEVYEDGILIKTNQEVQLEAIRLLGLIGGQEALDSMTALLKHCREYPVLYEAVNSSAAIEAENYDEFLAAMVLAMKNRHYIEIDNGFAFNSLYTLDNLMARYGVLLTPDMIKVLLLYSESAYMNRVKDYTREILMKY